MEETLLHSIIIMLGIISYSVLTVMGHDGNAVLTAVLGYAGGAGVQKAVTTAGK